MTNVPTMQELLAVIADLQAKNIELAARKEGVLSCSMSKPKLDKDGDMIEPTKGAVSCYGVNSKFPVTLYANQWEKLAAFMPTVLAYIKTNDAVLNRSKGSTPRPFKTDATTGLAIPFNGCSIGE